MDKNRAENEMRRVFGTWSKEEKQNALNHVFKGTSILCGENGAPLFFSNRGGG